MEAIINLLQSYNLTMLEVILAIIPIFYIGYRIGSKKVKKLTEEMYSLQRDVLDLNEEILYGKSDTPVIEIKHESLKITNIAK
jgi:hypothetical protein